MKSITSYSNLPIELEKSNYTSNLPIHHDQNNLSSATSVINSTTTCDNNNTTCVPSASSGDEKLPIDTVLVFGAGNFGMALSYHLAHHLGDRITIYARDEKVVNSINNEHVNPKYLSQFQLPENMKATRSIDLEIINNHSVLLFSIPTQFMRSVLLQFKDAILQSCKVMKHLFIFANKGIESDTLQLPYQIIENVMGKEFADDCVFLSGPSFAVEICQRQVTCVTVASQNVNSALWAQRVFHSSHFRVYTSDDPVGVEVCGALKNVIAIASGVCSGLGFQMNTRAALLTRGLNEITKIGSVLGANPLTMSGLAGIGDLFLTCTSEKSRNFTVGFRLGKGEKINDILANLGSVAEGVPTTKAAFELVTKLGINCPIIAAVYGIIYQDKEIKQSVKNLLEEEASVEFSLYQNKLY